MGASESQYFYLHWKIGQYLELSEDKNTERYQQLLADFEKRKKVRHITNDVR